MFSRTNSVADPCDHHDPWHAAFAAETEAELTRRYSELPSGQLLTLPTDRRPDDTVSGAARDRRRRRKR